MWAMVTEKTTLLGPAIDAEHGTTLSRDYYADPDSFGLPERFSS